MLTTDRGLRLLLPNAPGVEAELHRLADLERECCAFADWSVHPRREQLVLEVTADGEEGIAAVQAMFDDLSTAPAASNG